MELVRKQTGTDAKLWIIGDSFTGLIGETESWQFKLYNHFIGNNVYVSSRGSRDIQTVFDIFLQNLYKIQPNDFVILFFPTLSRFRLPLKTPYIDVEFSTPNDRDEIYGTPMNSMIGNSAYTSTMRDTPQLGEEDMYEKLTTLEWPLNYINVNTFEPNPADESQNFANISQMIGASRVFADNWNLILKSIKSYVPFELIYCSWTNELDSNIVDTKSVITNKCKMWHTLNNEFEESDGKSGNKNDVHWSLKMNEAFFKNILTNYPQYFKDEYKEF